MMSGSVHGPLPPSAPLPVPTSSGGLVSSSSHAPRKPLASLSSKPVSEKASSPVADISLDLDVNRISSGLGARLVVGFVELVMYLKGQVPFPPSTLRIIESSGRKGSPQQTKLLKSLYALAEDLPSTLETLGSQQVVTLAVVFGLGRAKCFVHLSGTDFAEMGQQYEKTDGADQTVDQILASSRPPQPSNENLDASTRVPERVLSSRLPLQEITPPLPPSTNDLDSLTSQLASVSLKPNPPEAAIRRAERALAQAVACSDVALSGNLNPMGAQIYMRASRGFKHPKWVVRQDAARMLDGPYEAMISGGGQNSAECVRVRANGFVEPAVSGSDEEMIWWGWEGRLAGYA
ncbi:hypothetical protein FRC08_009348 [Ceratobasidium sp. 394]|nr:hypothetical protein FRC08_009348 [Ceratobasidium sp. 394]